MNQNLFLSVVSLFIVLHLCKAGPLRLHKRAAFYIANETACVVDNIVYSNGEPIPTDDPCEACKCRPPGFACVLLECKVKPGCKAVRRVGQCCPEYVCGCEHNGRMYRDGEQIRDPKNPCYECHCQGSSIACAFVDCFFRDDCDSVVYMPGECCPQYKNCTRDVPDNNQFRGSNPLPPVNLLPALNDESVLPVDVPSSSQKPEPSEKQPSPTETPTTKINDQTSVPEMKESTEAPNEPQIVEEKDELNVDRKEELNKDENETAEVNEETKPIFNSEAEIIKKESEDLIPKADPTESSVEVIKEKPQTTVSASYEVLESESQGTTEKSPESVPVSTESPESKKEIKNSAADNGKSLKISDEKLKELPKEEKAEEERMTDEKVDETITEHQKESNSELQTETIKENSSENIPKEAEVTTVQTQTSSQATSLYASNEKIKSESAETVTIIVHVKPSAEKEVSTETAIPEMKTSTAQESLLKSHEIDHTEMSGETTKADVTTAKNVEIFPSSTEIGKNESPTISPSTKQPDGKLEERSDEVEYTTTSEVAKVTSKETPMSTDLKTDDIPVTTPTTTKIIKEVRSSETIEEEKASELVLTTTDSNAKSEDKEVIEVPSKMADIEITPKIKEESEPENKETKSEEKPKITNETKPEEKVEVSIEVREDGSIQDDKIEISESAQKTTAQIMKETSTEKLEISTTEKVQVGSQSTTVKMIEEEITTEASKSISDVTTEIKRTEE